MSAPIGRGERMVLTGYGDMLEIRLEPFVVDGMRPERSISQRITWEALSQAVLDLFDHSVGAMRKELATCEQCGNPLTHHKLDCGRGGLSMTLTVET